MRKIIIIIVALGMGIFCWGFYNQKPQHSPKTIVILYASTLSYHSMAYDSFIAAANDSNNKIVIRSLSTPDVKDKTSCTATAETALNLNPACIVVIGKVMSQILSNLAKKRMSSTPIIFIGADTPVELELVQSLDHPGGNVTGVFTTESEPDLCGKLLYAAWPNVKSVLIPYHCSNDIGKSAERLALAIETYLINKNINVRVFPIDIMSEAMHRIEGVINDYDLIMTLESDSLSEPYRPGLVKLTNRYNIALFSGSQAAISEGALFSYEVSPRFAATAAFEIVKKIIYHHQHPGTIPVVRLSSSREFIINTKRATELGIALDINQILHTINTDPILAVAKGKVKLC